MLLYDGTGTHALLEKRKRKRKNIGLDFSIIFENWLNLWKYKHWKLVEAQLHTWYALYSAFCVCVFLYFLLLSLSVYFSFFQCSWFSVSSSVFVPMLHLLFFAFYTRDFVILIFLKPHSFFFYTNQPSIHTKRYVRHVWDILNQLYFISAWFLLLCYFVGNSESAGRKTALKCGLIWAPSTRIRRKKLRFQKCQDSCGQGRHRIHSA